MTTGSYNLSSSASNQTNSKAVPPDTEDLTAVIMEECPRRHKLVFRRGVIVVLWALTISFIGCTLTGKISPKRLSFPCDEEKVIIRPFNGDTISGAALFTTLFLGPVIVFAVVESLIDGEEEIRSGFHRSCLVLNDFISGFFYVLTITELLKVLVSEQRPHFFYTCKPDWKTVGCSDGYTTEYNCTGDGPWWLVQVDIFKSFPSGHASLSFYTFVFISAYIHLRPSRTGSLIDYIRPWVQLFFFCWTLTCCFTRITDNRHYWWDVLAGVILGTIIALYMIKFSNCKTFGDFVSKKSTIDILETESEVVKTKRAGKVLNTD